MDCARKRLVSYCTVGITFLLLVSSSWAQDPQEADSTFHFKFSPDSLFLNVGDEVDVTIQYLDDENNVQPMSFFLYSRGSDRQARRALKITPRRSDPTGSVTAKVKAYLPGSFTLTARTVAPRDERMQAGIPVTVAFPPLDRITFINPQEKLYTGTTFAYRTKVFDTANLERKEVDVQLTSSKPEIASLDPFGNLTAHKSGTVSLIAKCEGLESRLDIQVKSDPVKSLELSSDLLEARTGDVIHFKAVAKNKRGETVTDALIHYAFVAKPMDNLAPAASGQIEDDGRFVAETPGLYTIIANSGSHMQKTTVRIVPRNVRQKIEIVGHGAVLKVRTSDLWVWEGVDGRDYAITGTWNANGEAYFWDVTDPSKMTIIDTITVDARTVNDVKVSEDGRIAVISREWASNRRNGIVILDISNPYDVKILSTYDDELTGGVHNLFIYANHVYAVNNGRRYDIINIEDPTNPHRVGRFELDTPGHSVHDVWIQDGIAYSSNWQDGLQLVDIGTAATGGPFKKYEEVPMPELNSPFFANGSPSNPVQFANYEYPSGWNHAAFPFYSKSTNKFYVLAGDEARPSENIYAKGLRDRIPGTMTGWIHFVDFTDPKNSHEAARYQVPNGGSHNYWVEDDILYAAFYQGGFRVVDLSGELMGDLYRQGREIASFLPTHADGFIPNAPMVWGPQPHKGTIFLADMNSGLWAVRLIPNNEGGTN